MKRKLNKKGFTLIELLAVVSILLLLVGIAVPSIMSLRSKNVNKVDATQEKEFISLAKIVATDYKSALKGETNQCYFLSLNDMIENDLLAEMPTDANGNVYDEEAGVKICDGSPIEYTFQTNNTDNALAFFDNLKIDELVYDDFAIPNTEGTNGSGNDDTDISSIYNSIGVDNSGANTPEYSNLGENYVAAVYDETCDEGNGCWRVADPTKDWYNYEKGIWANIIELQTNGSYCSRGISICWDNIKKHSAEYYKNNPGTPISLNDISSFWVWIPRFKETSNPQLVTTNTISHIETTINFVNNEEEAHPAFTKETVVSSTEINNTDVAGFWVQKFEGAKNMPFWVTNNYYTNGYSFADLVSDSMITNYEWGAISILSLSQYGNKVNESCNFTITPTYAYFSSKKSYSYTKTGVIGTEDVTYDGRNIFIDTSVVESNTVHYGQILGNPVSDRNQGYCGSTSGTVYGVYDMVGGFYEIVFTTMASSGNSNKVVSSNAKSSDYLTVSGTSNCTGSSTYVYSSKNSSQKVVVSNRTLYSIQNRVNYSNTGTTAVSYIEDDNYLNNTATSDVYANLTTVDHPFCNEEVLAYGYTTIYRGKGKIFSSRAIGGSPAYYWNIYTTKDVMFNE